MPISPHSWPRHVFPQRLSADRHAAAQPKPDGDRHHQFPGRIVDKIHKNHNLWHHQLAHKGLEGVSSRNGKNRTLTNRTGRDTGGVSATTARTSSHLYKWFSDSQMAAHDTTVESNPDGGDLSAWSPVHGTASAPRSDIIGQSSCSRSNSSAISSRIRSLVESYSPQFLWPTVK